jgi:hypothetical protein
MKKINALILIYNKNKINNDIIFSLLYISHLII